MATRFWTPNVATEPRRREGKPDPDLCGSCPRHEMCNRPCGRLKTWLGQNCRQKASVHDIPVGAGSAIDKLSPLVIAWVQRGCLRDKEDGTPWPQRGDRRIRCPKTGRTKVLWKAPKEHFCYECAQFRNPKWCQWLACEILPEARADGCCGWEKSV